MNYKCIDLHEFNDTFFFGREKEYDILRNSIIEKKDKIVAISGDYGIGKSSLCAYFLNRQKAYLKDYVQIINFLSCNEFPEINKETILVVIEDLSSDSLEESVRVNDFIKCYSDKQFLLIGQRGDILKKYNPSTYIHLNPLSQSQSDKFLKTIFKNNFTSEELLNLSQLANGQPLLLRLISHYLSEDNYNVDNVIKLINENFQYYTQLKGNRKILFENTPEFYQLQNDIKVVNGNILEKIKLNPNDIFNLTSRQFEEMIAELMIKRGYSVDLTKSTKDGGKDLIIASHDDIGNFIYYVECKKYSPDRHIGVNLVRELVGTINADRVTAGIMITSSYYSPDAIHFSEKFRHQISLIDYIKLKEWINIYG